MTFVTYILTYGTYIWHLNVSAVHNLHLVLSNHWQMPKNQLNLNKGDGGTIEQLNFHIRLDSKDKMEMHF